ncbi:MAG: RNA polymerase sigma factor [Bradymonadia bacterium]
MSPAVKAPGPSPTDIDRALGGDATAVRMLIGHLTPVVQARVARALMRRQGQSGGRSLRQEVEDLSQEVFCALFADKGKILRSWSPDKGASLANFVGLVAERQVASIMRSGKRSPWTEDPTLNADLDRAMGTTHGPEVQVASREMLERLLELLKGKLSPLGLNLFYSLYVEQKGVSEVQAQFQMTADAVYAWRSRLGKLIKQLAAQMQSDPA